MIQNRVLSKKIKENSLSDSSTCKNELSYSRSQSSHHLRPNSQVPGLQFKADEADFFERQKIYSSRLNTQRLNKRVVSDTGTA